MKNQRSGFTLKRFHVFDDRCAMKVGTDAVLLGAWAPVDGAARLLDIGTGSGILSLMLAQRGAGLQQIDALDIDLEAVAQAEENAAASPWAGKIRCIHGSLQDFQDGPYDLLVSNPPYFHPGQTLKTPERQAARHCGDLSHTQLLEHAERLSHSGSRLALILPVEVARQVSGIASEFGWFLSDSCDVLPKPDRAANRQLLCFKRTPAESVRRSELTVRGMDGRRSAAFAELAREFYLK